MTAPTDARAVPSGMGDSGGSFTGHTRIIHSGNVGGRRKPSPSHAFAVTRRTLRRVDDVWSPVWIRWNCTA